MGWNISGVEIIFLSTLSLTFFAAYLGRKHSKGRGQGLADEKLNKWLIGLSAGATANSGFIVTGAVGLGYSFGPQWLFLPISWFLGDLVFWRFFPQRINAFGRQSGATTLSELLSSGLQGKYVRFISVLVTILILVCLGGYTTAQWIAGQKFVSGAFQFSTQASLLLFTILIVAYSSIGGFRGSVYADTVQAIIRIIGTLIAIGLMGWVVLSDLDAFSSNIENAGSSFIQILPGNSLFAFVAFVLGFGFAALGFGLGQPQLVSRYLAGSSPEDTKAAKWIYIGFVQFTWISMTLFGVLLRGVMPDVADPETGLSVFFASYAGSIVTGIIVADIFATIAATSNSLLVAMAQSVVHDILPQREKLKSHKFLMTTTVLILGLVTMGCALMLNNESSVFELAIGSVSLMGAGLAAPVLVKIIGLPHTDKSILISILAGVVSAVVWKYSGYSQVLNEAAIGIVLGFISNYLMNAKRDLMIKNGNESV